MAFDLERQYQQYLYPESMAFAEPYIQGHQQVYPSAKPQKAVGQGKTKKVAIKILILNKPSKLNKKLLKFFDTDLGHMNRKGFVFEWIVVHEDEMEYYEQQDILEFPCMIRNDYRTSGATAIINALRGVEKKISKDEDGGLTAYFNREINNLGDDDDMSEADTFAQTVTQKLADMNRSRNVGGQHASKFSKQEIHERTGRNVLKQRKAPPATRPKFHTEQRNDNLDFGTPASVPTAAEIARSTAKTKDMDDDLMARFWENNEETDV